jgi:hypothetical protein
MGALKTIPNEAQQHIEILTELLRDVDLEQRMYTLIKAEEFLDGQETNNVQLQLIRSDLEIELKKMQQMIFIVDKAQTLLR